MRYIATAMIIVSSLLSAQVKMAGPAAMAGPAKQTFGTGGGGGHTFAAPASANNRCYGSATSGTSKNCVLTTAPASGSFVTVFVFGNPSLTAMTVSDGTNSYTATSNSPSNVNDATAGSVWMFYWYATTTGGTTVTASWTGTCSFCSIMVNNWGVTGAGAVVPDVVPTCAGAACSGNGTVINNPTITSPTAGDLLLCFEATENTTNSANSPWTIDPHGTGAFNELGEYILSASGTQACAFGTASGHWDSIGASFK